MVIVIKVSLLDCTSIQVPSPLDEREDGLEKVKRRAFAVMARQQLLGMYWVVTVMHLISAAAAVVVVVVAVRVWAKLSHGDGGGGGGGGADYLYGSC